MNTPNRDDELRLRLKGLGLSDSAVRAAWPRWWTEDAEESPSARVELKFGIARRLGLDPRSLLDEDAVPRFLWQEEARFKHLSGESEIERAGIASFGRAVATALLAATPPPRADILGSSPSDLRRGLLDTGQPYVGLSDLLVLSWGIGIPIAHLRVFPWPQKRMAAMTVRVGERSTILLAKDAQFPAPIAFYVAHELGHIALGHLASDRLIVDLEDTDSPWSIGDHEEEAADEFALELLTGNSKFAIKLDKTSAKASARELARIALENAAALGVEPGTFALSYGYSMRQWGVAIASLKFIYASGKPVWREVNGFALDQLDLARIQDDATDFVLTVLDESDPHHG